jgi:hypothetical protein
MKKTLIGAVAASLLLLAGCNPPADDAGATPTSSPVAAQATQTPTPAVETTEAGFQVTVPKVELTQFEPSSQKVDLRRDTKNSTLVLGNYDFVLAPMSANSIAAVEEGQVRVHVGLKGGDAATYEAPLPPGEYDASKTFVDVLTFKDGNEVRTNVDGEAGTIVITESDDNHVVGTLDITGDGGVVIKGEFDALVATEPSSGAETPTPESTP